MFGDLYVETILAPTDAEAKVDALVERVREKARGRDAAVAMFTDPANPDPAQARSIMDHPLPHWIEQMTVNYLEGHGGRAARKGRSWSLVWPDNSMSWIVQEVRSLALNMAPCGRRPRHKARHSTRTCYRSMGNRYAGSKNVLKPVSRRGIA